MKLFIFIFLLCAISCAYDRTAVYNYAYKYWSTPNHDCNSGYLECTPYIYLGGESCNYGTHGGDSANFVSQCILAGGHDKFNKGVCKGEYCGAEVDPKTLAVCLHDEFGWTSTCGYNELPPEDIDVGDVLIYHKGSCNSYDARAVIIVSKTGPTIACHSSNQWNKLYTYYGSGYLEWLHHP